MSGLRPGVTAVIPSIPPRVQTHLHRAVDSVLQQDRPVDAISVSIDHRRAGSASNRTRALSGVGTEWSALLDDDDAWNTDHVRLLLEHAQETGADLVYPWFEVPGGFDPWPGTEGRPFDEERLRRENYIPITVLVRTDLLWDVGGFHARGPADNPCDDWGTWERLLEAGATFAHLPRRTWLWNWHDGNTNGRADKW